MGGPIRVLFLTRYPLAGASSRYRVHQYIPALEGLGVRCEVQSFMDEELYGLVMAPGNAFRKGIETVKACVRRARILRRWREFDIIYMQRELFPFGPPLVERWLKHAGARLIFDYDDALFIGKKSRFSSLATMLRRPGKVLQLFGIVDCVVAGNDWLRDVARSVGARAVTVEVAEDASRIPMHAPHTNERPVTIGWLGSPSTVKYLDIIAPVLREVAREHPKVQFELVGGGDCPTNGVPWRQARWTLKGELEALARFDIGLMPLPEEEWALGKSGGKARTYMAAGVVPVCTAIGYNLELIRHGETGFLCSTEPEWREVLVKLIEDAPLRQRIAAAARKDVEGRFSIQKQARALRAVFDSVLSGPGARGS